MYAQRLSTLAALLASCSSAPACAPASARPCVHDRYPHARCHQLDATSPYELYIRHRGATLGFVVGHLRRPRRRARSHTDGRARARESLPGRRVRLRQHVCTRPRLRRVWSRGRQRRVRKRHLPPLGRHRRLSEPSLLADVAHAALLGLVAPGPPSATAAAGRSADDIVLALQLGLPKRDACIGRVNGGGGQLGRPGQSVQSGALTQFRRPGACAGGGGGVSVAFRWRFGGISVAFRRRLGGVSVP